jgi:bile acid:Na+ symporter, BASS family
MDPKHLVSLLAQAALFLMLLSFGLQARWIDMVKAMADRGLILRGITAVNLVVPIAALVTCSLLALDPAVEIGIIVMSVSPLAPLAPAKMKGGGDVSKILGLYVALILAAVILVPVTVALLSKLLPVEAAISVKSVAVLVAKTILLPTALGVAIATVAPGFARPAAKVSGIIGLVGVLILVGLIANAQRGAAAALMGDGTLLAISVIVGVAILGGHLLGRDRATSNSLAMAAAIRHPGIAALIIQSNFADQRIMLTVVLFLVTSVLATTLYQLAMAATFVAAKQRPVC